jgi:hypothetical protein
MNSKEILRNVIASGALYQYVSDDTCLDQTIKNLAKELDTWERVNNIIVSNKTISASRIEPVFRTRLEAIVYEIRTSSPKEAEALFELRDATLKFVDYLAANPTADITSVTINCDKYHYDIKCGFVDQSLEVICVIKGNRIPDELLHK